MIHWKSEFSISCRQLLSFTLAWSSRLESSDWQIQVGFSLALDVFAKTFRGNKDSELSRKVEMDGLIGLLVGWKVEESEGERERVELEAADEIREIVDG